MSEFFFDHALLPGGWARDVRIGITDGSITAIATDARPEGAEHPAGIAVPGLANLHCHAFQRGMAGLAEHGAPNEDDFWTWREVMYRFLAVLSPDDVQAIAAFAYMEMLQAGYTAVAEFHYLHHAPDGEPYADLAEMAGRIIAAVGESGIGLTLLPSLYAHGTFGGAPPVPLQRRFLNDPDRFLALVDRCRTLLRAQPDAALGIAPHSLRAVSPPELAAVVAATPAGPVHIHAAEQIKEVEQCLAWSGRRPVEWLLERADIGPRWCLIHATHMTEAETSGLARSGAVAGLCPLTEANLGDGVFRTADFVGRQGHIGIGSDSNISTDPAAELRQLEYAQRLAQRSRNVLAPEHGGSTGRRLLEAALTGGAQATARSVGAIAPGCRGDIVILDPNHPDLCGRTGDFWIDGWIFSAGRSAVRNVLVGGKVIVTDGVHARQDSIIARYRDVIRRVAAAS
ncbi:MAG TPA: formimidoylglutamate deiminase [Acetobacteraceae bacterium]|nr:formimidoylglutamate deiminase [Acetobacteraceae bacterium]